jgi:hypothetical protein
MTTKNSTQNLGQVVTSYTAACRVAVKQNPFKVANTTGHLWSSATKEHFDIQTLSTKGLIRNKSKEFSDAVNIITLCKEIKLLQENLKTRNTCRNITGLQTYSVTQYADFTKVHSTYKMSYGSMANEYMSYHLHPYEKYCFPHASAVILNSRIRWHHSKWTKKSAKQGKNSIIPPHKTCISVHKSTQSSMFYNNKEDHSLSTHHWHNSNLYYSIRVLFWGFMQQRMVVLHRHFRTTYQCHLQGSNSTRLLDPLGLDPYVVPEHQYEITVLCCIKSQKSADLNDAGVEACKHAHSCIPHYQQTDNIIEHQHAWEVQAASTLQVGEYPPRRS